MPYCYLIGWKYHNMWYYGVRYAKNCNPSELWVSYFTSSRHVKNFAKKYGKPDVVEIRRSFDTQHKAVVWEQTVLRRLNVEKRRDFLNARNSTTSTIQVQPNKTSFKKGNVPWNKDKNLRAEKGIAWTKKYSREKTTEERQKLSAAGKRRFSNTELRMVYSEQARQQYADPAKKQYHKDRCVPHSDKIWINNGVKNKRVTEEKYNLEYHMWKRGRLMPNEVKLKMKRNRKTSKDSKTGQIAKQMENVYVR